MPPFHNLEEIPFHSLPVGRVRVLAGKQLMVFWGDVDAGTAAPRHAHDNEQITWLVSGRMDFQVGDEPVRSCGPGTIVVVPANTMHEAWYREKCEIVEFFNPPRLDLFPAAAKHPYAVE